MDERTHVETGWGMVHNEYVELNAGFAHDPGTSAYEQMRDVCHSWGLAVGRLNAAYISIDCTPNIMESQAKGKYRDKQGRPLPGAGGDLARSCDDQLLGAFRAVKRIAEERKLLFEQRDREREHELDDAYGASTDDETESHVDVELEQQSSDDDNDGRPGLTLRAARLDGTRRCSLAWRTPTRRLPAWRGLVSQAAGHQ